MNTDIADGEPMVAVRFEKVAMPRMWLLALQV